MCTKIVLKDKANNIISIRTMEATINLEYAIQLIPRKYKLPLTYNKKITNLGSYSSKYAHIGIVDFKGLYGSKSAFHEGLNEKGLSISGNAFRKVCQYPLKEPEKFQHGDFDGEILINYLLSQYSNLEDVITFFNINENKIFLDPKLEFNTCHFMISDSTGESIVVEPLDGKFKITKNPENVMTNAPQIEYHFMNLSNYYQLSPYEQENKLDFKNEKISDYTHMSSGTGANGLPGGSYSMNRFVRAAFFRRTVMLDDNISNSLRAAWTIANNFDIPFGSNRENLNPIHQKTAPDKYWIWGDNPKREVCDQAVITLVQDNLRGVIQYKDWKNQSIREINMHDYNLDSSEIVSVKVFEDQTKSVQKVFLS